MDIKKITDSMSSVYNTIVWYGKEKELTRELAKQIEENFPGSLEADNGGSLRDAFDGKMGLTQQKLAKSLVAQFPYFDKKYDSVLKKIQDLSEEEQTPQLKKELYDMILPFVRKYQPMYYAQYKGELQDLASDIYVKFMERKGRGEKKENLLDKFDPSITVLPYLVKVGVQRALIDYSRSDKGEINYSENFDDEDDSRRLTLNLLSKNLSADEEEALENIEFTDDFIGEMKDRFSELSPEEKNRFRKALAHYRKKVGLHSNFDELFSYLEADMEPEQEKFDGTITIEGKQPNFTIVFTHPDGTREETPSKSRNIESALKKARIQYPGAKIATGDSAYSNTLRNVLRFAVKDEKSNLLGNIAALKEEILYAVEEATSPDNVVMLSERFFTDSEGNELVVKVEQNADDVAHAEITPEIGQPFIHEFDPNEEAEIEELLLEAEMWYELL